MLAVTTTTTTTNTSAPSPSAPGPVPLPLPLPRPFRLFHSMPASQKDSLGGLDDSDFGRARSFRGGAKAEVDADWNLTPEQREANQRAERMQQLLGITVQPRGGSAAAGDSVAELRRRQKVRHAWQRRRRCC